MLRGYISPLRYKISIDHHFLYCYLHSVFVHLNDVCGTWLGLKPTLPAEMESFADYYKRTWTGTDYTPFLFTPWMWNQYDNVLACLPRSFNLAEGWHNGFRCLVGCSNHTIWPFIDVLKKELDLTDWKINQKMMRQAPPPQQKKWKD